MLLVESGGAVATGVVAVTEEVLSVVMALVDQYCLQNQEEQQQQK